MKLSLLISLVVIVVVIIGFILLTSITSKPLSNIQAQDAIDSLIQKSIGKKHVTNAIVSVDSPKHGIHQTFVAGKNDGKNIDESQPFHIASVGKAFTATLIGCLIDDGLLSLDDKISNYLDEATIQGLFVFEEKDYADLVTIRHLLNHTSGVADYFEDDAQGSQAMQDLILKEKDRIWSPIDLVDFTRNYQRAVAKPGTEYHYSDTGYILLGLIIENVSGKSFDKMLHKRIFTPLEMNDSYLMFYSKPVNPQRPIADVWLSGVNIKDYNALSIDWAGGGIISTASDLSTFIRSLNNYKIISKSTLNSLYQFDNKFMNGIHYGNGFMQYHFSEFFPTLKSLPKYIGHMGILGTQMFYDKNSDTVYISSFGSTDYSAGSVQVMIKILSIIERIK